VKVLLPVLYIIYQEDRDAGAAEIRAANREKHLAYLDQHADILVLGGALLADDGVGRTGSCLYQRGEPGRGGGVFPTRAVPQGRAVQEREDRAHAPGSVEPGSRTQKRGRELVQPS
jgi:uncharacterized protein